MSSSDEWGCLLWLFGTIAVFWFWDDIWYSKLAYALYYSVDSSHVAIEKMPHDCDFLKAPIGEKECHYKRVVSTVEIGMSTTNTPIESFDGGKTWIDYAPDPGITVPHYPAVMNVTVTWDKVDD